MKFRIRPQVLAITASLTGLAALAIMQGMLEIAIASVTALGATAHKLVEGD